MSFFKILSIVLGLVIVGVRPFMHLIPQKWNDFELNKLYKEKKPRWILSAGILNVLAVGFVWYKELVTDISLSILVTLIISSSLLVAWNVVVNYYSFRKLVQKLLLEDRNLLLKINIMFTLLGLGLLFLGFFVY